MIRWFNLFASLLIASSSLPVFAPAQVHDAVRGGKTFATNCSGCHGSDGRGGERAPNIATVRAIVSRSDSDLAAIVTRGVPGTGMPSFGYLGEQGTGDVVAYLRTLQGVGVATKVIGDPAAGRTIFYGKGGCSKCHMIAGKGGFMAPDLSDYGSGVSETTLRRAVLDPDSHLQQAGTGVVELHTASGETYTGILRTEDNFNIVLQTEDGRFHMIPKTKLAAVHRSSHSLMPKDFSSRLSGPEIQNLISFLSDGASGSGMTENLGGDEETMTGACDSVSSLRFCFCSRPCRGRRRLNRGKDVNFTWDGAGHSKLFLIAGPFVSCLQMKAKGHLSSLDAAAKP